jgi:hypothetical protein
MRPSVLILILAIFPANVRSQNLSPADMRIIQLARSKYYNLEEHGFGSAECSVNFDFSTIPALNSEQAAPNRKLLEFTLRLDSRAQPVVQYAFPSGTSESVRQRATPAANMLESFVTGLFQTWPTKGLEGPIPLFDSEIEGVSAIDNGYSLTLRVPDGPVRVKMDKNYLVTEIVSSDGKIDERPTYSATPDRLVYTGNSATVQTEQNGRLEVTYDLRNDLVDGLRLPVSAHLRVNTNTDLTFTLTGCSVTKGKVNAVKPK